jgi:hypothetical protein
LRQEVPKDPKSTQGTPKNLKTSQEATSCWFGGNSGPSWCSLGMIWNRCGTRLGVADLHGPLHLPNVRRPCGPSSRCCQRMIPTTYPREHSPIVIWSATHEGHNANATMVNLMFPHNTSLIFAYVRKGSATEATHINPQHPCGRMALRMDFANSLSQAGFEDPPPHTPPTRTVLERHGPSWSIIPSPTVLDPLGPDLGASEAS